MTEPIAIMQELVEATRTAYEMSGGSISVAKSRIGARFSYRTGVVSRLVHGLGSSDCHLMGEVVADAMVTALSNSGWQDLDATQKTAVDKQIQARLQEAGKAGMRCADTYKCTTRALLFPEETPT